MAFCLYAAQIVEPARRLSEVHAALQTTLAAAARVYELIDLPATEPEGGRRLPHPTRGEIRFDRVSFGYGQEDPVLRDVSFSIDSCEQVALVGATGAGKSTIAGLLIRFFTPEDGVIRVDGIDCRDLSLTDLRRAVCVVEQGPFLFSGPLIDNIRYGAWDAPRQRIDDAVRLAGLEPLVSVLPHGVESPIEESGRDLSGGEKQRIALARAIVRDPAVLVLDEATSAIDSQTEALVFDGMRQWMARRTVVAITHRLATAIRFPRCIVLDGGRVAGDGAPEALLETSPAFAGLFREQLDPLDIGSRPEPGVDPLASLASFPHGSCRRTAHRCSDPQT